MEISEKAEQFVFEILKDKLSKSYTYHNFDHTRRVAKAAETLAIAENITPDEKTALLLAAWFHDTGYIEGAKDHEQKSVAIFTEFAHQNAIPEPISSLVESLIRVTEMCLEPATLPEKIIRDADCSHFGDPGYAAISQLLKTEWENTQNKKYTEAEWCAGNIKMLTKWHKFYTDSALRLWQPQKENNIQLMKEKAQMADPKKEKDSKKDKKDKKKKKDKNSAERGIETMFRVTLSNHTKLSQIADSKANILLSVNAIIISISLSTLIPKLDNPNNSHLVVPTFTLLLFSVVSIIFAILATRPKVNTYSYNKNDVDQRKVNLLFFGNFYKMPIEDYQVAMKQMMLDKDYLYESLVRDLYLLGKVLHRKYKLLRITYNIFMLGIILSVIAYAIAFKGI
jgi:predicted metal-dependent HD superfamily phosphohydrolase